MRKVLTLWNSTVGKKVIMALSGAVWVGFVILHVAGNLQAFVGQDTSSLINSLVPVRPPPA